MAEEKTRIAGLEAALDINVKDLEVYGDCIMIISQSIWEWGVKDPELPKYKDYLTRIGSVSFNYLLHSKVNMVG